MSGARLKRLAAWLADGAQRPFEIGRHDCALFAAGAVAAQTGVDYAAPFRGRYTTELGGLRILRRAGYRDHVALAAAHLRQRGPGDRPRPGDLAVIPASGLPALGVVQGAYIYALSPTGLGLAPLAAAAAFFEVG